MNLNSDQSTEYAFLWPFLAAEADVGLIESWINQNSFAKYDSAREGQEHENKEWPWIKVIS
jgi:hypothetical protein